MFPIQVDRALWRNFRVGVIVFLMIIIFLLGRIAGKDTSVNIHVTCTPDECSFQEDP